MFCLPNLSSKGLSGRFIWQCTFSACCERNPFVSPDDQPKCTLLVVSHPGLIVLQPSLLERDQEQSREWELNPSEFKTFVEEQGSVEAEQNPLFP